MQNRSPENINSHEESKYLYAVVTVEGIATINDGREFLLEDHVLPPYFHLDPPYEENAAPHEVIKFDATPVEKVIPVHEDLPFSCSNCGEIFQRYMINHTMTWMYTAFSCPNHRDKLVYLDVFPKMSGGGLQKEWSNAFMMLDMPRLPEGVTIIPHPDDSREKFYKNDLAVAKEVDNRYLLTPENFTLVGNPNLARFQRYDPTELLMPIDKKGRIHGELKHGYVSLDDIATNLTDTGGIRLMRYVKPDKERPYLANGLRISNADSYLWPEIGLHPEDALELARRYWAYDAYRTGYVSSNRGGFIKLDKAARDELKDYLDSIDAFKYME
jgi:hypothetical protein